MDESSSYIAIKDNEVIFNSDKCNGSSCLFKIPLNDIRKDLVLMFMSLNDRFND
jgi:hypothetical protein